MMTQAQSDKAMAVEAKKIAREMVSVAKRYVTKPDDENYKEYQKVCSIRNVLLVANGLLGK